jgi:hypothetical protein
MLTRQHPFVQTLLSVSFCVVLVAVGPLQMAAGAAPSAHHGHQAGLEAILHGSFASKPAQKMVSNDWRDTEIGG